MTTLRTTNRLRDWRSSGSSWTLYISTLPLTLHKWYLNIPPAQDDTYIQHPSLPPIPTVRTSLHLPRGPSQPASNQSDLEGYHPSASASKQDGNRPTAPRTCPIDAALINNPYLPGKCKAPAQPKRTRLPHTDRRTQPAPKPTPLSAHNQDPKPPLLPTPPTQTPKNPRHLQQHKPPPMPQLKANRRTKPKEGARAATISPRTPSTIKPHPPPESRLRPAVPPPQQPHPLATDGPRRHSNLRLDIRRITAANAVFHDFQRSAADRVNTFRGTFPLDKPTTTLHNTP
jgi:hypothetical protein